MLDRTLQRDILEAMATRYPNGLLPVSTSVRNGQTSEAKILANLAYLAEHGLVTSGFQKSGLVGVNDFFEAGASSITARGLDFLADDGGLGAILNVVTIRLDALQLAEMLACRVEQMEGVSPEERSLLASTLRKFPEKAIETVSCKLLDWAADHAQDAFPPLRMWLSQLAGSVLS